MIPAVILTELAWLILATAGSPAAYLIAAAGFILTPAVAAAIHDRSTQ